MKNRIIAIRPRTGLNPDYLRNLKADTIYQLDNQYEFELQDNEISCIHYKCSTPKNFYQLNKNSNVKINISSIIGVSGAGKTTITELMISAIECIRNDGKEIGFDFTGYSLDLFYLSDNDVILAEIRHDSIKFIKYAGKNCLTKVGLIDDHRIKTFYYSLINNEGLAEDYDNIYDLKYKAGLNHSSRVIDYINGMLDCMLSYYDDLELKSSNDNSYSVTYFLDSIDSHLHPVDQRKFVINLIKRLEEHKVGQKTIDVNLVIITNSPYVMSDLLSQFMLALKIDEDGRAYQNKELPNSFCGNIHEISSIHLDLTNDIMGEHSSAKLSGLITKISRKEEITKDEGHLIESVGDGFMKHCLQDAIKTNNIKFT